MAVRFVGIPALVDSLTGSPTAKISTPELVDHRDAECSSTYFGLALSAHHGTTTEALGLKGFESVFRNACEAVGWAVKPRGSATQRFVDETITLTDGTTKRLSLKSTSAQRIKEETAHISKLDRSGMDSGRERAESTARAHLGAVPRVPRRSRRHPCCASPDHYAQSIRETEQDSATLSAHRDSRRSVCVSGKRTGCSIRSRRPGTPLRLRWR